MNAFGAPVRDSEGNRINRTRDELVPATGIAGAPLIGSDIAASAGPPGFVPTGGANRPFWQYALFGSGIGLSNIIIVPASGASGGRDIIIGGNSVSNFGANDFWQVIRHNSTNGNYDQIFVSPIYPAKVKRIAVGNVVGDSQPEIVVMLQNGRFYFYDLATRAELGYVTTSVAGLEGLSVADLNGDGYAELIVTNYNPGTSHGLFVFDNAGHLLWQVPGPFAADVITGQMDNDPALEIATTHGEVIDSATHAIQWTRSGGLGTYLRLAPLPGASYQQLIVGEPWYHVYGYDVAAQQSRWSIDTPQDVNAVEVADVDNDGTPEIIIGDGQWGTVHVHDLITQAQKWPVTNPEHGVTNIAVGDVDNDGTVDLIWGAGYSTTGSDHLYVANTTGNHAIKWQNVDLVGPFLGPLKGDLDGDGQPELVVCSFEAESSYASGRILVFDLASLNLRGMSAPVVGSLSWMGVHDLKLCDLEGDGRMEIVVAADRLYDGVIEIYGFDSSNTFTLKWTNTTRPSSLSFNLVEIADLDNNGTPEIIAGTRGSAGVYVYIYDYPSGTNPWRSVSFSNSFHAVSGLVVEDIDGNGGKEIAALVSTGDLYTFDGPSRQQRSLIQQSGGKVLSRRVPSGLIQGDSVGVGHFLQYSNNTYTESFTRQLGPMAVDGINVPSNGGLWSGSGGAFNLRVPPSYDNVEWQSPLLGPGFGRFVATDSRNGEARVFSSTQHAVAGFIYESSLPSPTPIPGPGSLGNISTRLRVETGDNVLIAGFIVNGTQPKKIIVRAIGPSLPVSGALADPILELRNSSGGLIRSNDNWRSDQETEIIATTMPPIDNLEAALVETLPANGSAYTAIVSGVNNGTGVALVEVYDLDQTVNSKLANISTRGLVQTGDNVLIAGMIVLGQGSQGVIIRAIGPSLTSSGVSGALADPTLNVHNGNGVLIAQDDDWRTHQEQALIASGLAPTDDRESAILMSVTPGNYTAIVRGKNDTTGVALVEVYNLQ